MGLRSDSLVWTAYNLGRNLATLEVVKAKGGANVYGWNFINDVGADRFVGFMDGATVAMVVLVPGSASASGANQVWPTEESPILPIEGVFGVQVFDDLNCATPSGADDLTLMVFST
jgi:hypothetical protein